MTHKDKETHSNSSFTGERPKTMKELPPVNTRDTEPELPAIQRFSRQTQVEIKPLPPSEVLHCVPGPEDE